jgi:hypothetical protein
LFKYFEELSLSNKLPDIEDLQSAALQLHHAFSSTHGIYQALYDTTETSDWAKTVQCGSPWTPPPVIPSSVPAASDATDKARKGENLQLTMRKRTLDVICRVTVFLLTRLLSCEMLCYHKKCHMLLLKVGVFLLFNLLGF